MHRHCTMSSPVCGRTASHANLLSRCSLQHKRAGRANSNAERVRCQAAPAGVSVSRTPETCCAGHAAFTDSLLLLLINVLFWKAAYSKQLLLAQKPSRELPRTVYCTRPRAKQIAYLKACPIKYALMAEPLDVALARPGDTFAIQSMTKTVWP